MGSPPGSCAAETAPADRTAALLRPPESRTRDRAAAGRGLPCRDGAAGSTSRSSSGSPSSRARRSTSNRNVAGRSVLREQAIPTSPEIRSSCGSCRRSAMSWRHIGPHRGARLCRLLAFGVGQTLGGSSTRTSAADHTAELGLVRPRHPEQPTDDGHREWVGERLYEIQLVVGPLCLQQLMLDRFYRAA